MSLEIFVLVQVCQLEFSQKTFFSKFKLPNLGCSLSISAAYTWVFTVYVLNSNHEYIFCHRKVDVLRGLGAEIVRTPTEAKFDSPGELIASKI
jgi:hypothetical protein